MGNVIRQTNRTMLMEVINPGKLDLATLIGDVRGVESLSDDKIKEINDHLLVYSFDEALEKFAPVVYCYYNANNQKVVYQLEKPEQVPEEMLTEIPLNRQNEFMGMLMNMVDTKRAEGIINVDFKFEKLTDMISPKKVMDAIKQNRKELQYTYGEYAKLEEDDPKKQRNSAHHHNVWHHHGLPDYRRDLDRDRVRLAWHGAADHDGHQPAGLPHADGHLSGGCHRCVRGDDRSRCGICAV